LDICFEWQWNSVPCSGQFHILESGSVFLERVMPLHGFSVFAWYLGLLLSTIKNRYQAFIILHTLFNWCALWDFHLCCF
jgi:hypothetical protein